VDAICAFISYKERDISITNGQAMKEMTVKIIHHYKGNTNKYKKCLKIPKVLMRSCTPIYGMNEERNRL